MNAATRANMLRLMSDLTIEQLNEIPKGFNNNMIWNFAHVIITQQLLVYKMAGLPMHIHNEQVELFRKGSKPERMFDAAYFEELKALADSTYQQFKTDKKAGLFKEYKTYATSYGVTLNNPEDAIAFNNMHEAMHLGYMIALKKVL
ncbi:MAG: hypothetical protein ACI9XO_002507 [Paraglaciecola sp.]|jgi:hypothetical protein